jgi:hypothetical protein
MGRWVTLFEGAEDGIEGHLEPRLPGFHSWYARLEEEPEHEDVGAVLQLLGALVSGMPRPVVATAQQAWIVDRMVADFYGFYRGTAARNEVKEIEGPMLYVRRYESLAPWVAEHVGVLGRQLWNHLLEGRGIWRNGHSIPFDPGGDDYFVSYVTLAECRALAAVLASITPPRGGEVEVEAYGYVVSAVQVAARDGHGLIMQAG